MNTKYFIGQKIISISSKPVFKTINGFWSSDGSRTLYEFREGGSSFEDEICTMDELRSIHNELENICLTKNEYIIKILKELKIYTMLFEIENFLCDHKEHT